MDRRIRYGVVGLGKMGSLHIKLINELKKKAVIVALSDTQASRLRQLKKEFPKALITSDYRQLLGVVDAVSICTPTETHCAIAEFFLENKIPALVEKPIATNLTEAEKMLWASQATATHLHIGHIERFNPAVIKAKELIQRPVFIEAVRFSPYEDRVRDIGVILDLMIHDLDLILWMLGDLDVRLEEYGGQGLSLISPHEDLVKARLRFVEAATGAPIYVDLTANRLSTERIRKMRIFQEDSYLSLDLTSHQLRYSKAKRLPLKKLTDIHNTLPKLRVTNPLRQELEHFLKSIEKNTDHDIHPREAWDALELALQLVHAIDRKNIYARGTRQRLDPALR